MPATQEKVRHAVGTQVMPDDEADLSTDIAAEPRNESCPLVAATAKAEALGLMFRMASAYQRTGGIHQAIGLYDEIMVEFPDSLEAQEARRRLLDIAREHEEQGKWRSALCLYRKVAEED